MRSIVLVGLGMIVWNLPHAPHWASVDARARGASPTVVPVNWTCSDINKYTGTGPDTCSGGAECRYCKGPSFLHYVNNGPIQVASFDIDTFGGDCGNVWVGTCRNESGTIVCDKVAELESSVPCDDPRNGKPQVGSPGDP